MTRLLLIAASAALFATGASAQMAPAPGSWEPSAENCKKPQYASSDACKNFMEGRSSDAGTANPGTAGTPGNNNPGGSAGAGASGSGANPGSGNSSNSGSGAGGAN